MENSNQRLSLTFSFFVSAGSDAQDKKTYEIDEIPKKCCSLSLLSLLLLLDIISFAKGMFGPSWIPNLQLPLTKIPEIIAKFSFVLNLRDSARDSTMPYHIKKYSSKISDVSP